MGLSFILVTGLAATAEFWLIGQVLGQAIVLGPAAVLLWSLLSKDAESNCRSSEASSNFTLPVVLTFSWPLAIVTALSWLQSDGYRFVLSHVSGDARVGLFAAGYALGAGLMIAFEELFHQFYQPLFYKTIAGRDKIARGKAWNEYASAYLPTILLMGTFVALGAPLLIRVLVGEKFQGVGVVIVLATVRESIRMVSTAYYMAALGELDMRAFIFPYAMGSAAALAGVYFLAPWDPLIGTGLALCLAAAIGTISLGIKYQTHLPIALPWAQMFRAVPSLLPLVCIFLVAESFSSEPSTTQHVLVLATAGIYMLGIQLLLARRWIGKVHPV